VLSTRFEKPNTDEQGSRWNGPESLGFVIDEGVVDLRQEYLKVWFRLFAHVCSLLDIVRRLE